MWSPLSRYTTRQLQQAMLWQLASILLCLLSLCSVILDTTLVQQLLFLLSCVSLLPQRSAFRLCPLLTLSLAAYGQARFSLVVVPLTLGINAAFLLYSLAVLLFFRHELSPEEAPA